MFFSDADMFASLVSERFARQRSQDGTIPVSGNCSRRVTCLLLSVSLRHRSRGLGKTSTRLAMYFHPVLVFRLIVVASSIKFTSMVHQVVRRVVLTMIGSAKQKDKAPFSGAFAFNLSIWRRRSESNRRRRLCRPLHDHSATPPGGTACTVGRPTTPLDSIRKKERGTLLLEIWSGRRCSPSNR